MEEATEAAKEEVLALLNKLFVQNSSTAYEIVMFTIAVPILLKLLVYNSTTLLRCLHYKNYHGCDKSYIAYLAEKDMTRNLDQQTGKTGDSKRRIEQTI
jgi:hypothetical protein